MPLFLSLKRALTFNFILVAVAPVLVFGLVNIDLVAKQQLEGVRERTANQANSLAKEVEAFQVEVQHDLQHVEQAIEPGEILNQERINTFLSGVVRNSQFFESIYLLALDYHVKNFGVLPTLQSRKGDYANLDFSGHALFKKMIEGNNPVWSDTFVSMVTGDPSVTVGVPMPDGYLLGNISLNSLNKLLQRYTGYEDIKVAIVDSRGVLIAHSDPETASQRLNFNNHPTVLSALRGISLTSEFEQGDQHLLESTSPVGIANWAVWVGLDMNKLQEPIRRTRNLLISIMLVATVLACGIAIMNVRRLLNPLTALGQRAMQIADGYYEFSFRPSGFEEIDLLAGQISSMTAAIKDREESIVANELRFRRLVNSIDGIVWEMEYPSFRFLFVSKQAEAILGYPMLDWYEDPDFWSHKSHPDDFSQAKAFCQLMSEKHEDHNFEFRMITADDRAVWIRNLVTVVVENGRPARLLGVMLDVTHEKELVDELAYSEQNYREIFNSTSDAIFIHDAETGKILDVNRSMLKMYNCRYEDALLGKIGTFSKGEPPYTGDDALEKIREAKVNGSCSFEWRARKASGEVFWADVILRSATIGDQPRILASVRDITSRKATEQELDRYRSHLEELIEDRSRELEDAQEQLVQQERLAVLGQLTATVSHEIRNPLGTVANALYLLKEELNPGIAPHLQRPLQLAERNVERCDGIISDLLDFSRQRKILKLPLDIDAWLMDLINELSLPEDIHCTLDLAVGKEVPADAERLRRVMVNVITNAIHALEDKAGGEKKLLVKTRLTDHQCEIAVEDNGHGMSKDVLEKIFEPMFSTKNFGVGLGVPIIKSIMEGHNGSVRYMSEAGAGTTVFMTLPVDDESPA